MAEYPDVGEMYRERASCSPDLNRNPRSLNIEKLSVWWDPKTKEQEGDCASPGCRGWAMKVAGSPYCSVHGGASR